ncbi:hypothetical protein [Bacillus sp. Marseille-Q1617]|uniref:hypothetical protein n=1 Tax=Bacillus sp. Marseille-Q1617 TaxID=2736887 RepID=UPI00158A5556|nr:hypothetical protein [Bacillus sp. Marseille-Q1617]
MVELILFMLSFVVVIILYRNSEEEEPYLFMKLLGYTILGAFMLEINRVKLPLGFVVFLLFFRGIPINAYGKKRAAYLGLTVFLLSVIIPFVEKEWYERPRTVTLQQTNFYEGSLLEEWKNIKKELDVENEYGVKLTDMRMVIDTQGEYEALDMSIVDESHPYTVFYRMTLTSDGEALRVKRSRYEAEQWITSPHTEADFVLTQFDLVTKPMLQDDRINYYELRSDGQRMGYAVEDQKKFRIDTAGKKELEDSELPVDAIVVDVCGTEGAIDEHGMIFECDTIEHYLFGVMKREVELNSGTVLETAGKISPQIGQWLKEHTGEYIGSEKNGKFILKVDGKERPVTQQEYMKALKEMPVVEIIEEGHDKWKVKVENPYGDAPHLMEFVLIKEGPEVSELHFGKIP